ncbi:MAG: hypothetical protein KF874_12475 [Rhizobiaceae bacterium]|nr:hypothetical protein [Rhizobiaceae bacterium]
MSDTSDKVRLLDPSRSLAEAVRSVKNAEADRDDVVIEMRDAERMRLEILAAELGPVIAEVPKDLDIFDFALSAGLRPRFWVDTVSHVSMGRDKRTYRFLKDTRNGRIVLAESTDPKPIANQVTRYIAERIVERERAVESGTPFTYRSVALAAPESARNVPQDQPAQIAFPAQQQPQSHVVQQSAPPGGIKALVWGVAIFLLGVIFGLALLSNYWWEVIARS